jgi:hypothetical protein
VLECEKRGDLYASEGLHHHDTETWVQDGIRHLGLLHENAVIKLGEGAVWTEDLPLLYFYRNRLTGYGLSLLGDSPDPQQTTSCCRTAGWPADQPGPCSPNNI